jgi:hypothetical protein
MDTGRDLRKVSSTCKYKFYRINSIVVNLFVDNRISIHLVSTLSGNPGERIVLSETRIKTGSSNQGFQDCSGSFACIPRINAEIARMGSSTEETEAA